MCKNQSLASSLSISQLSSLSEVEGAIAFLVALGFDSAQPTCKEQSIEPTIVGFTKNKFS